MLPRGSTKNNIQSRQMTRESHNDTDKDNDDTYKKLATIVEGDPKAPFSIATTPRCRGGRYSIPRIAPLYP